MREAGQQPQRGICPQCGGPLRADRVTVDLNKNLAQYGGGSVELSPTQAVILSVLSRQVGEVIPHDQMFYAIWGGCESGVADERAALWDQVGKLREKIAPLGLQIRISVGVGYYLAIADPGEAIPVFRRRWHRKTIQTFLALCERREPRDRIADALGWSVPDVVRLHEYLQRVRRQRFELAPPTRLALVERS